MTDFFRFPHTPYLTPPGVIIARDDKVLNANESKTLVSGTVVIEEKIDGANLGLSLTHSGHIQVQNRGQFLVEPYKGQFSRLPGWLREHKAALSKALRPEIILFGEWCAARHSLDYTHLPDWFLVFDIYDRNAQKFWSTTRRNRLAENAGLITVWQLLQEKTSLATLHSLVMNTESRYRSGSLEGIIIRQESVLWCEARAKLVRADFTQTISDHWRGRIIQWNKRT